MTNKIEIVKTICPKCNKTIDITHQGLMMKQQGISQTIKDILDIIDKLTSSIGECLYDECLDVKKLKSKIKALDELQKQNSEEKA